ncbi:sulfate respiration complex protein HmcC [Desulfovibrio cuneatus]|uniref:sulfate respiration complex protein HmcC n=1 Tax=Desulfovibrio cuneatus TaxID=159728 RepID=UPI0004288A20|nr:NrfD/PsrC family molybdoenzyme membrane anchor subunit [Desulfovibrio cuneatus]
MNTHDNGAKNTLLTPGNVITAIILLVGLFITVLRFTKGIGSVTALDDNNPWGIWISFDLLCGVVLAAGGYTTTSAYYLFGLKHFRSAVRPAITSAFLGYAFVVFALHYDVGQPWRLVYPIFVSQGTTSILFEVGLCVFLYVTVLAIEFSPAVWEWLGIKKLRSLVLPLTIPLTILGVILSTMHQSSLGALYLIAPSKMHPLWYSSFIPVFFFISSMFAGMSMVIFEGILAHKGLHGKMDALHLKQADGVVLAFGKASAFVMMGYLFIRFYGVAMDNNFKYLFTGYGLWFLVETIGFVALPAFLYAMGARERNVSLMKIAAVITVLGVVLNRFNVSQVAFNYQLDASERYFPHWMEIGVSVFVVTLIITAYRFICTKMPVMYEHPEYKDAH